MPRDKDNKRKPEEADSNASAEKKSKKDLSTQDYKGIRADDIRKIGYGLIEENRDDNEANDQFIRYLDKILASQDKLNAKKTLSILCYQLLGDAPLENNHKNLADYHAFNFGKLGLLRLNAKGLLYYAIKHKKLLLKTIDYFYEHLTKIVDKDQLPSKEEFYLKLEENILYISIVATKQDSNPGLNKNALEHFIENFPPSPKEDKESVILKQQRYKKILLYVLNLGSDLEYKKYFPKNMEPLVKALDSISNQDFLLAWKQLIRLPNNHDILKTLRKKIDLKERDETLNVFFEEGLRKKENVNMIPSEDFDFSEANPRCEITRATFYRLFHDGIEPNFNKNLHKLIWNMAIYGLHKWGDREIFLDAVNKLIEKTGSVQDCFQQWPKELDPMLILESEHFTVDSLKCFNLIFMKADLNCLRYLNPELLQKLYHWLHNSSEKAKFDISNNSIDPISKEYNTLYCEERDALFDFLTGLFRFHKVAQPENSIYTLEAYFIRATLNLTQEIAKYNAPLNSQKPRVSGKDRENFILHLLANAQELNSTDWNKVLTQHLQSLFKCLENISNDQPSYKEYNEARELTITGFISYIIGYRNQTVANHYPMFENIAMINLRTSPPLLKLHQDFFLAKPEYTSSMRQAIKNAEHIMQMEMLFGTGNGIFEKNARQEANETMANELLIFLNRHAPLHFKKPKEHKEDIFKIISLDITPKIKQLALKAAKEHYIASYGLSEIENDQALLNKTMALLSSSLGSTDFYLKSDKNNGLWKLKSFRLLFMLYHVHQIAHPLKHPLFQAIAMIYLESRHNTNTVTQFLTHLCVGAEEYYELAHQGKSMTPDLMYKMIYKAMTVLPFASLKQTSDIKGTISQIYHEQAKLCSEQEKNQLRQDIQSANTLISFFPFWFIEKHKPLVFKHFEEDCRWGYLTLNNLQNILSGLIETDFYSIQELYSIPMQDISHDGWSGVLNLDDLDNTASIPPLLISYSNGLNQAQSSSSLQNSFLNAVNNGTQVGSGMQNNTAPSSSSSSSSSSSYHKMQD